MSDSTPGWQADPTGRHDHRYWDGTRWTDHVADAGVASSDPYDAPAVDTPSPTAGSSDAQQGSAASLGGWATSSSGAESDADADAQGSGEAASASAAGVGGWTTPDASAAPSTASEWSWPDTAPDTPPSTSEDAAEVDEPTVVAAVGAGEPDDAPLAYPSFTDRDVLPTPVPSGKKKEKQSSRASMLTAVGALALAAVVGGGIAYVARDTDDGPQTVFTEDRLAAELSAAGLGLDEDTTTCIAERLFDQVGADRFEDISLSNPPDAELKGDVEDAFPDSLEACDVDPEDLPPIVFNPEQIAGSTDGSETASGEDGGGGSTSGGSTSGGNSGGTGSTGGSTSGGGRIFEPRGGSTQGTTSGGQTVTTDPDCVENEDRPLDCVEGIENFEYLLANQYEANIGLDRPRAECLANKMGEALRSGKLDETEAYDEIYQYLDDCDISLEELEAAGTTQG